MKSVLHVSHNFISGPLLDVCYIYTSKHTVSEFPICLYGLCSDIQQKLQTNFILFALVQLFLLLLLFSTCTQMYHSNTVIGFRGLRQTWTEDKNGQDSTRSANGHPWYIHLHAGDRSLAGQKMEGERYSRESWWVKVCVCVKFVSFWKVTLLSKFYTHWYDQWKVLLALDI